ncbi:hypothetical protein EPUS_08406 [Endocarpon pusillum Z07020]|uniref:Uncharacterized protein n=1 Tax=Endocarpon pusillum (strain Z07020 / HMAS-L-300199) TaxID=1263415 RepID=U1G3Y1_ENDPU|nr:uncharacterized protein EPUS_08406 [Endocarpon pusillum Z07020]ERF72012.1 hypothetical protein EPUS_08406 [Endocarpon pusillum Z07020]
MAEDVAELGLEAVDPILNHREVWQNAKNKAKTGLDVLRSPESPRRRFESDDEQTPHLDKDKRGSKYEKSNRRHSQYKKDSRREDDAESDHQEKNALSDRRQRHRSGAGRPRIERRASSLDRGDFEKDRGRRRRYSQREDRAAHEENADSRRASRRIEGKDALAAGVAGIAAIYIASGFYKDRKSRDTQRGRDAVP